MPMSNPKPDVQEAWVQFQTDMKTLRDQLRQHYEPNAPGRTELQDSLNRLGRAADEVFESIGRASRDPGVRDGTRPAARSFGSAMAETFRDLADELAAAMPGKEADN